MSYSTRMVQVDLDQPNEARAAGRGAIWPSASTPD